MNDPTSSSPYSQRGFAAVPRSLRDHPAFKALNAEQRLVVLTLYVVARWGEGEYRLPGGTIVKVPAASYFGSTRGLADECRVDYQVVFRLIRNPLFSELWEVQTVFFDPEARNRGESKPKQPAPDGDAKSKQAPKQAGTLFTMRYGKDIFLYAARNAETAPETDPKQPLGEDRNRSETAPKHKDTREQGNTGELQNRATDLRPSIDGLSSPPGDQPPPTDPPRLTLTPPGNGEDKPKRTPRPDDCPHEDIIDLYHRHLPANPRIETWSEPSRRVLRTRWREDKARQTLAWWRTYFARIASSDFLTGRKTGSRGPFLPSLKWLVEASHMEDVINGKYENRGVNTGSARTDQNIGTGLDWAESIAETEPEDIPL